LIRAYSGPDGGQIAATKTYKAAKTVYKSVSVK
jgi:hypothetical protein